MKKLLILITVIVCLGFFLAFAGVPITGFLKWAGILAAILVASIIIGGFIFVGTFYVIIIFCLILPMAGALFLGWFFETVFHWGGELIFLLGFFLTLFLCGYLLEGLFSLIGALF